MVYTVSNPRGSRPEVEIVPMNPHLPGLDGKVVCCVAEDRPVFIEVFSKRWSKYTPANHRWS